MRRHPLAAVTSLAGVERALASLAVLACLVAPSALSPGRVRAQPQPQAVELTADGVFGHDAFVSGGYTTLVVRATNRTQTALQGEVRVEARSWEQTLSVHRAPLDLPARESRTTTLTLPAFEDGLSFVVSYRAGGGTLAETTRSLNYAGSARPIVVLDDPPRLRASLVGTRVQTFDPGAYSAREVEVPIGIASTDPRSGDLLLPDTAAGWSTVLFAIATVPSLGHAGEAELRALEDWIRGGGHLVVMPTRDADLDHPFVRRTVGSIARGSRPGASLPASLGVETAPLACPAAATREAFGCQVRVGFGAVWITDLDLTEANVLHRPETTEILRGIARVLASGEDRVRPFFALGRGVDRSREPWEAGPNIANVRSALDPNEGYRPALVLVGIVLLAYVLLVGPVNFTIVERRKQPTLALVTTPALALLCVAATFLVGYVGKGVIMRYRRIELLDTVDGSGVAISRRYTGFFYTRPASADLELAPGTVAVRLGGASDGPVVREGAEHRALESMRAGLWETAFVREDAMAPMGGAIHFELDGTRIARVRNDSSLALHGAFMTDLAGGVYAIGEIAPGASVEVPTVTSSYVPVGDRPSGEWWTGGDAFLGTLGYRTDARQAISAMMAMGEEAPVSGFLPVLYARLDPDAAPSASPSFDAELDLRLLRVVPAMRGSAVYVVFPSPPSASDPAATTATTTGGAP